jgi:predicted PurR-regulated permease PerM
MAPELGTQWVGTLFGPAEAALMSGYSLTLTLANLLILPFVVFYLVVDWEAIHRHLLTLIPPIHRTTVKGLVLQIDQQISNFVRGQLFIGSILTLLYAVGLGGRGIELWFIIAILSGFGNLVPYLGFCVGIVLASIMSLFTYGTLSSLYWVWGIFLFVQFVNDWVLTPKVLGERVGLSPLVVLLAIFASGKLLGFLGVVLAIPICAVIRVLGNFLFDWVVASTSSDSPMVIVGEGTE